MKSCAMNALLLGSNNFNCINVGLNNGQYVPVWGPEAQQDSLRSLGNRLENDTPRHQAKKKGSEVARSASIPTLSVLCVFLRSSEGS